MKSVFGDRKTIIILLGPALLLYVLLKIVPVAWSLGLSFFEGNSLRGFEFVGVDNFVKFFNDGAALQSVGVSVVFAVLATAGQVTIGYLLALLYVFVLRRGSAFVRTAVFFPMVLPTVAVALLFKSFVSVGANQGPVNDLINFFGFDSVEFLASGAGTMAVALVMTWWGSMGFYAVLLFTGLLDIPEEVIESARLDGANGLKLVRHIVIPLSLPILLSSLIFSFNSTLKVFDSLLALNGGGPGTQTAPLTLYMYRTAFEYAEYGYGSTIAVILTVLCLVFTLAIFRSSRTKVED
ncbi:sugar ABC transporter permease [Agromyces atrinae]|uniref:Multiple sugar transport system permease protein/raffinose/stachyose/melibiose transport system permease protein n=1 Tax=Agromyces atrinae TaxID=592376 RepID=A0A4Q2MCN8_9MICO|nr:sugar ABC transporter permease [Agromyces atrinae]MCI2957113.1 sugar ABC transporter permease [Agromyces atrinae]NYD67520.1 multiple sugar transport system permease protein/raffinose/stachyose/melibiose transport system permease protein [Agromyces atrinae]RXZ88263.1 sugar ABC transporter permease [Agromyces atrinae]